MSWTGRPDDRPCCGDEPGAVAPGETVVRLIHSRIYDPVHAAFKRSDLACPDNGEAFDNSCGNADGCSVDRAHGLTEEDVRNRSRLQAAMRSGREAKGGLVAAVADLRAIESELDPRGRAVYVYDDPRQDNREHAVIRVSGNLPRADFDQVRNAITKAFRRQIRA